MPHGYLLLDLKQLTPDNCFRTSIFPDDEYQHVYIQRKKMKGTHTEREVPLNHM